MVKINKTELKKHVPKKGERIVVCTFIKDKKGKILEERQTTHKVVDVKVNERTGELTLKTEVKCPEIYPIDVRTKLANKIVDKIRPQIVGTADKAVRDSLAKESTPERLEKIQEAVEKTPSAKVEMMGKKGCLFLKIGRKKFIL